MRIAITGSRGFIGGSFARFAAAAGHEVLGISRSSQPEPGWPGAHLHADSLHSDLSPALRAWQPDAVLHAAGSASVADSLADPLEDLRASAMTLANTLDSVRRAGISPLLLIPSSAAIYGNPAALPIPETSQTAPISPYGFHKAACELLAREAAECFGLRVAVCRLFSVFGPRQRRLLVWEVYRQLAGSAAAVEIQGTGEETRDFLHIEDVCGAFLSLAQTTEKGCGVFNIAGGDETSVSALVRQLKQAMGSDKPLVCRGQTRLGDPLHWRADTARLRAIAPAWQPRPLAERLTETIANWQRHG